MTLLTQQFTENQQVQTFSYINWHSHSPIQWEKTTANVLIQWAVKICSNEKFLDEGLDTIKRNLFEVNNYPRKIVQNIIQVSEYP